MKFVELDDLYVSLAKRQPVETAQQQVAAIYEKVREAGDIDALRLAHRPYKKLQDEVRPALIYAASELPPSAEIQFHLADRGPDATAWPDLRSSPILIEVTVASGKVRFHQMTALNDTGMGHGYTDATDDDSREHIKSRYEEHRGYSTEEAVKNVEAAIQRCVKRKSQHDARTLVIYAPLNILPARHWDRFMPEIACGLPLSKCREIFVVGSPGRDACYQLK